MYDDIAAKYGKENCIDYFHLIVVFFFQPKALPEGEYDSYFNEIVEYGYKDNKIPNEGFNIYWIEAFLLAEELLIEPK